MLEPFGAPTFVLGSKITVITVVFNGAAHIARTVESTLSQDHENTEYVIVDGQSTDGTQAIVERYGSAIDVFISEPDDGIYDAMNKGAARATGDYLLFMNCGDTFASPAVLSEALRAARGGNVPLIFGGWDRLDVGGHRTPCHASLLAGLFNHQAVLYSRSLHQRFGQYANVRGFTTADYLFFMTIVASGSVPYAELDKTLAVVDISGVSAGPQTLSQKVAVDFLLGRASRSRLLMVLAGHPLYRRIKAAWRRLR